MWNDPVYEKMTDSEKLVAEYLNSLNLNWKFEYPIFLYDERGRPRIWTPDFYLTDLKVHIEVCGSSEFKYTYRDEILKKNKVDVIFLHTYNEENEWQNDFHRSVLELVKNRLTQLNILVQLNTEKRKSDEKIVSKETYLQHRNAFDSRDKQRCNDYKNDG